MARNSGSARRAELSFCRAGREEQSEPQEAHTENGSVTHSRSLQPDILRRRCFDFQQQERATAKRWWRW